MSKSNKFSIKELIGYANDFAKRFEKGITPLRMNLHFLLRDSQVEW